MASFFLPSSASWLVLLVLELFDAHFEPARRHREFGAELILVGLDFRHRQRRRGFEPAHGQAHGAAMNERDDDEPDQGCDEKADPEIHDRFNHGTTPPTRPSPAMIPVMSHDMRRADAASEAPRLT